jgi:hypothetical protein
VPALSMPFDAAERMRTPGTGCILRTGTERRFYRILRPGCRAISEPIGVILSGSRGCRSFRSTPRLLGPDTSHFSLCCRSILPERMRSVPMVLTDARHAKKPSAAGDLRGLFIVAGLNRGCRHVESC